MNAAPAWAVAAALALQVPQGLGLRWLGQRGLVVPGQVLALLALLAAGGGVLALGFGLGPLALDRHGAAFWTVVVGTALGAGAFGAMRWRRIPTAELALAALPPLQLALALAVAGGAGLAGPALRALLVAPAALGLSGYLGASAGYLISGAPGTDRRLGYEVMVGQRFLLSRSSPVLSTVTTISLTGVALGVWLVLVSLGILGGFEGDLQRKIIGANAHVVLARGDAQPFVLPPTAAATLRAMPGVEAVAPFVSGEVALASSSNYGGALLFGIDPAASPGALAVLSQLRSGSLAPLAAEESAAAAGPHAALADGPPPAAGAPAGAADASAAAGAPAEPDTSLPPPAPLRGIVLGAELAKMLHVTVGERVRAISPLLDVLTPLGPAAKTQGFRVAAIFASDMYEVDARYAFVALPAGRRFFGLSADEVTGLHLRATDVDQSAGVGAAAAAAVPGLSALDWRARNQTLLSALKLERVVAFVVLVFIILVASFSIVNTLSMSIAEKRREIAILKTMGAPEVGIMKIFLVQGLWVGGVGIALGAALGVATMALLGAFGFWIPGDVYYIDSLPVRLDAADVALVVVAALVIVWDFAVFPALQGSRLEPVEGLRDG